MVKCKVIKGQRPRTNQKPMNGFVSDFHTSASYVSLFSRYMVLKLFIKAIMKINWTFGVVDIGIYILELNWNNSKFLVASVVKIHGRLRPADRSDAADATICTVFLRA